MPPKSKNNEISKNEKMETSFFLQNYFQIKTIEIEKMKTIKADSFLNPAYLGKRTNEKLPYSGIEKAPLKKGAVCWPPRLQGVPVPLPRRAPRPGRCHGRGEGEAERAARWKRRFLGTLPVAVGRKYVATSNTI